MIVFYASAATRIKCEKICGNSTKSKMLPHVQFHLTNEILPHISDDQLKETMLTRLYRAKNGSKF